MRTSLQSLAWKEWHEHKWKFASLTIILWAATSIAVLSNEIDNFGLAYGMLLLCAIPLAVFVGLGTAANERSRGTMRFLQALPVPTWRAAVCKFVFGLAIILASIALSVALIWFWKLGFDLLGVKYRGTIRMLADDSGVFVQSNWYLDGFLYCFAIAASVYVWAAAAGVNRKDEISAGVVALAAIVGCWLLILFLGMNLFPRGSAGKLVISVIGISLAPGGIAVLPGVVHQAGHFVLLSVCTALVGHLVLARSYIRRFGRTENLEVRSPVVATRPAGEADWLNAPRRSPATAIAWKQARESAPVVAVGLAGIICVTALLVASASPGVNVQFGKIYAGVAVTFGWFVALVLGIGICFYDVPPQLNTFWRSRPINPDLWFWSKYATGITVLLAVIYGPMFLVAAFGDRSGLEAVKFSDAIIFPLVQLALFAAAVAMIALLRHPIYAAILSLAMVCVGIFLILISVLIARLAGWVDPPVGSLWQLNEKQVAWGFVISIFISTLLAWTATRRDWGWKSRY